MSIVGGAIAPVVMGYMADTLSMGIAFIVPMLCFIGVALFAASLRRA